VPGRARPPRRRRRRRRAGARRHRRRAPARPDRPRRHADAEAKQRAWERVTGDTALSNHETDAVAAGLLARRPGRPAAARGSTATSPSCPALWDARTPQVAGTLAQELFPSTLVEPDVHERTAVLEQQEHPAGLRRYVAEQRDDLRRALAARAEPEPRDEVRRAGGGGRRRRRRHAVAVARTASTRRRSRSHGCWRPGPTPSGCRRRSRAPSGPTCRRTASA
jgi:hypothetical protein